MNRDVTIVRPTDAGDLVQTESGLVVPASAVEPAEPPPLKRRVMPAETAKRLRRFIKNMAAEKIAPLLACTECGARITAHAVNRIVEEIPVGGEIVLRCTCSLRVIR